MTTPVPFVVVFWTCNLGKRDLLALRVSDCLAVTCILPSEISALKEWMAFGAGASSEI